ncbi:SRPBCC family protein [Spirillospora albida]|uniref:SRPBCC family protein n=1 Tax=Spirillospora albida TaxID=58123 RepID=UPI000A028BEC|nr:SRPBCC family protein [Spirillospora albida]
MPKENSAPQEDAAPRDDAARQDGAAERDGAGRAVEVTATTVAPIEVIYKHLSVGEAWDEWAGFRAQARRVSEGDEHPNGIGAVWHIRPSRRRVIAYDPPHHYGYVVFSGLPPGYRADITLEPLGSETLIRWRAAFERRGVPGMGPLVRALLRRRLDAHVRRVAWHAERCEPGCPARLPGAI